ncbi:plasmid mobilization relaxosome protein MobC [Paraburkholderia fungorum]|uniref:plasmid mobilization relaxosome protein MobC n=1 Tax=Paraburkholderia fungorum TaxID=134537 RepID=UPI001C1EEC4B|nr:plasmid mobilization relaxosome protein MobC [Paraburkholderia fungorum]MBU7438727.1 plasmid mobilization relaxosome protein MobC [Paraburkholderia fungorum]
MDRINLSMHPALKRRWLAYCKSNNLQPSEAFAQVVRKLTRFEISTPSPTAVPSTINGNSAAKVRLEIRLSAFEQVELVKLAEREGFSPSRWIVALIRARLSDLPQLGQSELELLAASNSQLLAIGRNLNQIARALNAKPTEQTDCRPEIIESLSEAIKSHTAAVSAVIQSNVQRWSR